MCPIHKLTSQLSHADDEYQTEKAYRIAIVQARQAAEWSNASFKSCWRRLRVRLPGNKNKRRRIIALILRLHNVRTRLLGLNHIQTTYNF